MDEIDDSPLQPDASELVLGADAAYAREAYIFEPTAEETALGRLYAVAETEERGGVGSELLDLTLQALQREYYRDPSRGILVSFESALHQANLVLHDTAESNVRDWMGYVHVAVAVLSGSTLHVSTAGLAHVLLVRKGHVATIAQDLSHSPITNPLRTFAQVASGTVKTRDVILLGTSHTPTIFRDAELTRFALEHSAASMSERLKQLYEDKGSRLPLSLLTISLLPPQAEATVSQTPVLGNWRRQPREATTSLTPRKPLIINRSHLKTLLLMIGRLVQTLWQQLKLRVWPLIIHGSRQGGRAVAAVSKSSGKKVQTLAQSQMSRWRGNTPLQNDSVAELAPTPVAPANRFNLSGITQPRQLLSRLPKSSKIFALITLLLGIALVVSLVLLQQKRAGDAAIVQASELLHDTRNLTQAADAALIYDNRDQARQLLAEADGKAQELKATGLYTTEAAELLTKHQALHDRLQRIVRASEATSKVVGDFKENLEGSTPRLLTLVGDTLYTFNPTTNAVLAMQNDGKVEVASETSQGIGFFTQAAVQNADKTIALATSTKGLALFDAKTKTLQSTEVQLPTPESELVALATYGTRLYAYDAGSKNIVSFSKTLRGYSGGTPWITNAEFPKDSIISLGVDGNVYTLHRDGTVRKLLKGEPVDFTAEEVTPPLQGATKLVKDEGQKAVYVLDPTHKRIVVYSDKGVLQRQIYVETATTLTDMAISADEQTAYVLDSTRVLAISLIE